MWADSPFSPRKWQAEALPIIIDSLRQGGRPVVSAIMGAGKSVLIAELVATAMKKRRPNGRIVVLAPRQALVRQLSGTIDYRLDYAGMKDQVGQFYAQAKQLDRPVIVSTFASAPKLAELLAEQGSRVVLCVCDEVHGTESDGVKGAWETLNPACGIGFTATPFRSNENESLTLWSDIVFRYTAADALRDQVIVPWELVHWDGKGSRDCDDVCISMIDEVRFRGPGIVSALDIEDAKAFANRLNELNIPAAPIHSRMKREERLKLLDQLNEGSLVCLVHVSLLAEGVDLPWLQWICLRRPVGAKVRFVQEVGRVLRCHQNKKRAYICDPHNLFGRHGLVHPEQIGQLLIRQELDEYEEELMKLTKDDEYARDEIRKMPPPVAMSHVESWIANVMSAVGTLGVMSKQNQFVDTNWRGGQVSEAQLRAIENMKWTARYLPSDQRDHFKALIAQPQLLKKGTASDMLSIMHGLAKGSKDARARKRHWKMPDLCWPVPNFAIQLCVFAIENN